MRSTITISLPKKTKQKLDKYLKNQRINRSDVIREALRQYFIHEEFQQLRNKFVPLAEKKKLFTDEDIFTLVS